MVHKKLSGHTFPISSYSHPCQNGGTCYSMYETFKCECPNNWEGSNCGQDVNECARFSGTDLGCQNGAECINKPGSYE